MDPNLAMIGAALCAGALVRGGGDELPPEVYTTPAATVTPGARELVEGLEWQVIGVAIDAESRPPHLTGAAAARPYPTLDAASAPWLWAYKQRWSLCSAHGVLPATPAIRSVPKLSSSDIIAWLEVWDAAVRRWESGISSAPDDYRDTHRDDLAIAKRDVKAYRDESRRIRTSFGTIADSAAAARAAPAAICRVAVRLSPTSTGAAPQPPSVYVSGWDHVGQLAREYVLGPLEDAASSALGAAGGVAVRAAGGVLTSPAGAALLLVAAVHFWGR